MSGKKLTDNEIIKALEGAILNAKKCDSKVWSIELYKLENALDLITRQQAENETLKALNGRLVVLGDRFRSELKTAKSEAVKEFAERLKEEYAQGINWFGVKEHYFVNVEDIDNLVKEMVGENND